MIALADVVARALSVARSTMQPIVSVAATAPEKTAEDDVLPREAQ
jgi:hypothetical protein